MGVDAAATYVESLEDPVLLDAYGGRSLHEQSHGESFLALVEHRFGREGLYLLDEPEAALSPSRQLTLMRHMHELAEHGGSQFVIATHSPLLLAYPGAAIFHLGQDGLGRTAYEDTEHYRITRDFLLSPERYFKHLFRSDSSALDEELGRD